MNLINALLPLFLIILLGVILRRSGFVTAAFADQVNRLLFWVGLPALLFYKSAEPLGDWLPVVRLFGIVVAVTLVSIGAGLAWCALARSPRPSWAAAIQGGFRGNLAFVGLPVILSVFPRGAMVGGVQAENLAVVLLAVAVPLYNVLGILVLLVGQVGRGTTPAKGHPVARLLAHTFSNPLILACIAGFAWAAFVGRPLPALVHRTCATLGEMTIPLSLLSVGAFLRLETLHGHLKLALPMSLIKVALAPFAGYLLARALHVPADLTRLLLIYLACPTAVASFIMAHQMGADAELSAAIIVLSVLLSIPALAIVLIT